MSAAPSNRQRLIAAFAAVWVAALLLATQFSGSREDLGLALLGLAVAVCALMLALRQAATAGLLTASVLVSLALAEFLLPWLLAGPADQIRTQYADQYWGRGEIGTRPNEGRFRTVKSLRDGTPIYDVVYSVGPDHQRITPGGAASTQRVNFFGCSVTYGEGLQDHETLPAYVAQQMVGVQTRNFAFHGYGPQQALAILQGQRETQGQVVVYVSAPWHALRGACKPVWTIGSPRYRLSEGGEVRRDGACGDVSTPWWPASATRRLTQSALFRAVRDRVTAEVSDQDIELYLAMVQKMAQIAHERNQAFVLGFVKADEAFFHGTRYSNATVLAELRQRVDDLVDLTLAPRAEETPRAHYLHELDRHPSALANLERAKLLVERLAPLMDARAGPRFSPSP